MFTLFICKTETDYKDLRNVFFKLIKSFFPEQQKLHICIEVAADSHKSHFSVAWQKPVLIL